ncbi:hypothetical protein ACJMK2_019302 [Sinanodonta woodiana]|uniref:Uncharacterized protein n=1 Tax=Sinanodonta woodiana TaxID=1069815 RepID=A0ABD3UHJ9_SINWO
MHRGPLLLAAFIMLFVVFGVQANPLFVPGCLWQCSLRFNRCFKTCTFRSEFNDFDDPTCLDNCLNDLETCHQFCAN